MDYLQMIADFSNANGPSGFEDAVVAVAHRYAPADAALAEDSLRNLGVPCIVVGLPVRYIHSHYSIASLGDFQDGVRLAAEIIRRLDANIIGGF